jgi:hypothetical protein
MDGSVRGNGSESCGMLQIAYQFSFPMVRDCRHLSLLRSEQPFLLQSVQNKLGGRSGSQPSSLLLWSSPCSELLLKHAFRPFKGSQLYEQQLPTALCLNLLSVLQHVKEAETSRSGWLQQRGTEC